MQYTLNDIISEYTEKNTGGIYRPVAVGKYGIRQRSEIYKKELAKDYSKNKVIHNNTMIIGMGSTQIDFGVLCEDEIYSVSPAYHTFNIKTSLVRSKYFDYLLQAKNKSYTEKYMIASARQGKTVNLKDLLKERIEIPCFETQKEIIKNVDLIKELIFNEEKYLNLLNELIKSRFIEMFGDVLRNSKNFQTCHFGEYVYQMNIGPFGSDLKNDCFVPKELSACMVYEQKHAIEKTLNVPTRYISNEKYSHLKRFEIGPGDIIVSCRGTVGECWILPEEAPKGIIHPSLMLIKPNDAVNHEFLMYLLERILSEQTQQGSGVKMAIRAKDLSKIVCIKPSREDQNHFIDFVHLVDKSKFVVHSRYFLCDILTLFSSTIA